MAANLVSQQEQTDAEQVDRAMQAIADGNLDQAERLLLGVIEKTPQQYFNSLEDADGLTIKFWDQGAFIHYVTWRKEHGNLQLNVSWIFNAYPRAHYYMGFLCVKRKQFERALRYLDAGQNLEPTNPKFALEKAQALVHLGRIDEAFQQYDQCAELGPWVSAYELAVGKRGRGFLLIEQGQLDAAEHAFQDSLRIDPGNSVALNELAYIQQLRQGGHTAGFESVATTGEDYSTCALCGKTIEEGVILSIENIPVPICKRCEGKLTKKWWQFWK